MIEVVVIGFAIAYILTWLAVGAFRSIDKAWGWIRR